MLLNVTISPTLGHSLHEIVALQVGTQEVLPRLDYLRVYGCSTVIYDYNVAKASKFQATGIYRRLVGYEGHAVYQVYVLSLYKVIRTKDAKFFEGNLPLDPDEDKDTLYDDVFPIQSTVKESNTSRGNETRVTFTNELVMILPSLYVEDKDVLDTELVQEIYDAAEDGDLKDLLPGIQLQTDILTTKDYDEEAASVLDTSTDKLRNRALRRQEASMLRRSERSRRQPAFIADPTNSYRANFNRAERRAFYYDLSKATRKELNLMPNTVISAFIVLIETPASEIPVPKLYKQSQEGPYAKQQHNACVRKYESLLEHYTQLLVDKHGLSVHITVIKGRQVFRPKPNANSDTICFKARQVVQGFTQKEGIDFDEIYAPVVKPYTLRVLFAMIAVYNLEYKQYDIITAFLNVLIDDRQIYVIMLYGFEQLGKVCLLLRALYGLRQSLLLQYKQLKAFLITLKFTPIISDICTFKHTNGGIIVVYVNDMLVIAQSLEALITVVALLKDRFKIRELGNIHYYLGIRIVRDRKTKTIYVAQDAYLQKLGIKYRLHYSKFQVLATPMLSRNYLRKAYNNYVAIALLKKRYQTLVGELLQPTIITQPVNIYPVGLLCRFLANPTEEHYDAAFRVLQSIVYNMYQGIVFDGYDNNLQLIAYADALQADDIDSRKSTGGYVLTYGGTPVSWKSGRQPLVIYSTTEAEYVQLALIAKEAIATGRLINKLDTFSTKATVFPITIYKDNQLAINIINRLNGINGCTKHIGTKYHYVR